MGGENEGKIAREAPRDEFTVTYLVLTLASTVTSFS
jgi:hypothetical protein